MAGTDTIMVGGANTDAADDEIIDLLSRVAVANEAGDAFTTTGLHISLAEDDTVLDVVGELREVTEDGVTSVLINVGQSTVLKLVGVTDDQVLGLQVDFRRIADRP